MAKRKDANDVAAEKGPGGLKAEVERRTKAAERKAVQESGWKRLDHVIKACKGKHREYIINGLLRRGETMNLIAPSKAGKSFLVGDLSIAVATGDVWLCDKWRCK